MERREFLKAAPLAVYGFTRKARASAPAKLEAFDYESVRLLPGRWQSQVQAGRDFYFSVKDDDILHGFRAAAGRPPDDGRRARALAHARRGEPPARRLVDGAFEGGLPGDYPASLRVAPPGGRSVRLRFRPFYEVGENYPYFMYFDRDALPWRLW